MKTKKLEAVGYKIELQSQQSGDFISLTDIAKYKKRESRLCYTKLDEEQKYGKISRAMGKSA